MVPLSPYKVAMDLKTPKVEEEMTNQVGNIHPLAINPDLHQALETSFEASMVSWHLGWHSPVLCSSILN